MTKKNVLLKFPPKKIDKPLTYHLVKDYNLIVNIFKAKIVPDEKGELGLELEGNEKDLKNAIEFLQKEGVIVESLDKEIIWDKEKCVNCSACRSVCPKKAIILDPKTSEVIFDREKCIACELCIEACPYGVIKVKL